MSTPSDAATELSPQAAPLLPRPAASPAPAGLPTVHAGVPTGRAGLATATGDSSAPGEPTAAGDRRGAGSRRPQAERSQESRHRILEATVALLVEEGYARTNTLAIQARAGVSRGRLLHQFPSKEELLVAAAHHVCAVRLGETQGAESSLPPLDGDPGVRLDAVIDLLWITFHLSYFWAATELWVAARTEPALADVIRPAERRLGRAIWSTMDDLFGPTIVAHPMYPAMRNTLFTSMRGVALTYTFDQRDPLTEPALKNWKQLMNAVLLTPAPGAPEKPRG